MNDLRARIAAIIDTHTAVGAEGQVTCWCSSERFDGFHAHSLHAADAVIRELNLQPETLCTSGGAILSRLDGKVLADNRRMTRWATPWECDESPVK